MNVITVIGEVDDADMTDNTVTIEDVWTFNRNTLDEAIKLVPGVTSTLDGTGRRNERGIFVRGFGRWQVPLSIDGIRIYLPADNRLDFNRFLTQDLAEIEVQKGYVSVLDGPGGMGGAINLITRKPTATVRSGVSAGFGEGRLGCLRIEPAPCTRQFYVQGSVSYLDRDYWELSDDFVPTAIEDGGERDAVRQPRLAREPQVRLYAERHGRILAELHGADGREGRAAARLQQPAESAEQLLALADVGHRQSLLAFEHAVRRRTTT